MAALKQLQQSMHCAGLLQVWNLVAGDNSSLTKPQFYSTLRLISLAQVLVVSLEPMAVLIGPLP